MGEKEKGQKKADHVAIIWRRLNQAEAVSWTGIGGK